MKWPDLYSLFHSKAISFVLHYQDIVIWYFWIINAFLVIMLIGAYWTIFRYFRKFEAQREEILLQTEGLPSVGIIVPAYNEENNIVFAVNTLLNLAYRNKEIIIVVDGATDNTLPILKSTFQLTYVHKAYIETIPTAPVRNYYKSLLYDNLTVVEKDNGGRSDAINVGVNACQNDYILTVDADTVIDNKEMTRMFRHIFTHPNKCGWGASIRVANGCTVELGGIAKVDFPHTYFGGIQAVEYLRAFYLGRMGFEMFGGGLLISGAFSMYPTDEVKEIGGYDTSTLGEDMEMATHMRKQRFLNHRNASISYVAEPVCWTEVPEDWRSFSRQRTRWQLALMQVMWKYKTMCLNPRYGAMGLVVYPYFLFGELLAPVFEALSYIIIPAAWILGVRDIHYVITLLAITWGFTTILNFGCCLLEALIFKKYSTFKHYMKMFTFSIIENFGFRQLYLWWRLKAFYKILLPQQNWWAGWKKSGFTAMNVEGERGKKK